MKINDEDRFLKILTKIKEIYGEDCNEFHKFTLKGFGENKDLRDKIEKIILNDIQSRGGPRLSKHEAIEIKDKIDYKLDELIKKVENEKFKDKKELVDFLYKSLHVKKIGGKINAVLTQRIIQNTDICEKVGFKKEEILKLICAPIDIHVKNLLVNRLQLMDDFDIKKEKANDIESELQKKLREIIQKSQKLTMADIDILWYIGFKYCSKRVACKFCRLHENYCKDHFFIKEAKKTLEDIKSRKFKDKKIKTAEEIRKEKIDKKENEIKDLEKWKADEKSIST